MTGALVAIGLAAVVFVGPSAIASPGENKKDKDDASVEVVEEPDTEEPTEPEPPAEPIEPEEPALPDVPEDEGEPPADEPEATDESVEGESTESEGEDGEDSTEKKAAPEQTDQLEPHEISINPGNVPTAADNPEFADCDELQPLPGQDIWVFVLPGNDNEFVSLEATFEEGGPISGVISGGPGTSKATVITPLGWTLTGATAVVIGDVDQFNLTHTCPGIEVPPSSSPPSPSDSESPSPSDSESPSPSDSESPSPSDSESPSPSDSVSPSDSTPPGETPGVPGGNGKPGADEDKGGLPVTGLALRGAILAALALLLIGTALQFMRRRRANLDE